MAAALGAAAAALLHAARPVKTAGGAWVRAATATLEPATAAVGAVPLHLHAWLPADGAPLAGLVVGVHGLNEHGAHGFGPHAGAFAAARLGLLAVDLPGHGRSTSHALPLGRSGGYEAALAAVVCAGGVGAHVAALLAEAVAAEGASQAPLPLYYVGASFGATLALDAACRINTAAAAAAAAAADGRALRWRAGSRVAVASWAGDGDGLLRRPGAAEGGGDGSPSASSPPPSYVLSSSSSFPLLGSSSFRMGLQAHGTATPSAGGYYGGGGGAGAAAAAAGALRGLHSSSSSSSSTAGSRDDAPSDLSSSTAPAPLRIAGVVAQAPLVTPSHGVAPRWYHGPALRLLSAVGATGAPLMRGVTGGCGRAYHPSHRAARVAEDAADPLVYRGPLRVGTAATLRDAMARAAELAPLLATAGGGGGGDGGPVSSSEEDAHGSPPPRALPVLLQHGTDDGLCDVAGSRRLLAAAAAAAASGGGAGGVSLVEYAGAHHDLLRERRDVAAAVVGDAVRWIAGRCALPAGA
jgi:alpha-beta hydrolase superfamily lysophospholipase